MGFLITLGLALGGGMLGGLAFPHWNLWFLLFPALMCLFGAVRRCADWRHPSWGRLVIGSVWGVAFFALHLTWLTIPAASPLPWVALSVLQALFIGGFAVLWGAGEARWDQHPRVLWPLRLLWGPVAWVGVEQLRSLVPWGGFPWSKLGFAMVDSPLIAWAPWGGSVAVGAVAVAVSLGAIEFFRRGKGILRRPISGILTVAVVVFPLVVPVSKPEATGQSLRVAIIQGNTPGRAPLTASGEPFEVMNLHVKESLRLHDSLGRHKRVDLVVWGENAADVDPRLNADASWQVNKVATAFGGAPMIFGTLGFKNKEIKNTIVYWQDGRAHGTYSKQHLVPFGEYLPWRHLVRTIAPKFSALVPRDIRPGTGVAHLRIHTGGVDTTVATPICFEIADDGLMQRAVSGASFIIIPTSNMLFGDSDQADQQLAIARFRAIEYGLDLVQASTMDSTARVNAKGEILGKVIPTFHAGSFVTAVPLRHGFTPAAAYGSMISLVALAVFAGMSLFIIINTVKESWNK